MRSDFACVGVSDHGGWAMLVTASPSGVVLDRYKVELKEKGLPGLPHHDESRRLALSDAVALVERVRSSARLHSAQALDQLEERLDYPIGCIALRAIPNLPPSVSECITKPWANARADAAMFREELAYAASGRGWAVLWHEKRDVERLSRSTHFVEAEADAARRFAPPWNADCRIALAGALSAQLGGSDQ